MLKNSFFLDEMRYRTPNVDAIQSPNVIQISRQRMYAVYEHPEELGRNSFFVVPRDQALPGEGAFIFIERMQRGPNGFSHLRHLSLLPDGLTIEFNHYGKVPEVVGMTHHLLYVLLNPEENTHMEGWSQTDLRIGNTLQLSPERQEAESCAKSMGMKPLYDAPTLMPPASTLDLYARQIERRDFRIPGSR